MARDAEKQAKTTYGQATDQYNTATGRSGDLYGQLHPYYENEMKHPQGFDPADLSAMETADEQSLGGSTGAIAGVANQRTAADRNSGGFGASLDEATRDSMRTHSSDALGTQIKNALMREGHRQEGVQGTQDLFKSENQDVFNSLGLENQSTNTLIQAGKSGWFQNMVDLINAGANVAKAVSGFPSGGSKAPAGGSDSGGGSADGWM